MAHFHHFSISNQNQSISSLVIHDQNTKAITLLSGQKSLIFITCKCAIKVNQFQIWSFLCKVPRLWPYIWPKMALSTLINPELNNNQIQIVAMLEESAKAIVLLYGRSCLLSTLFNLQSTQISVIFFQL